MYFKEKEGNMWDYLEGPEDCQTVKSRCKGKVQDCDLW